jgi:Ca-activated chloride channel family protein
VVLLLDRSGSMGGWKMVAARRAAARVVDTLTGDDRFAVLTFDHQVERPDELGDGLVPATDRHRFRAVEHLARVEARGGTELMAPLHRGLDLLRDSSRDRVLVLVTDGQVGNEDQILQDITPLIGGTRLHTIGIDRAVNAGFLGRLAALGAGRCELVESEDRLDEAMEHIHRRIGAPAVTDLVITADGPTPADDSRSPARLPGLYPGVPLVVSGRYTGAAAGSVTVTGRTRDDREFRTTVPIERRDEPAVTAQWARARLRDLEDRYAAGDHDLESRIVTTSLRFGVLCRFTAYVAIDSRVVNEDGETRRVTQPVELPSGWERPEMAASPRVAFTTSAALAGPRGTMRARDASATRAKTFAAIPSAASMARPAGAPTSSGLSLDEARRLVAVEAGRLREAAGRPRYEREEILADLASRLGVLLTGLTDEAYRPLRALLDELAKGQSDLDARWAEALRVLAEFGGSAAAERKPFWKR